MDSYDLEHLASHVYRLRNRAELLSLPLRPIWYEQQRRHDSSLGSYAKDVITFWLAASECGPDGFHWLFGLSLLYARIGAQSKQVSPAALAMMVKLGDLERAERYAHAGSSGHERLLAYHSIALALAESGDVALAKDILRPYLDLALYHGAWPDAATVGSQLIRWGDREATMDRLLSTPAPESSQPRLLALCEIARALYDTGAQHQAVELAAQQLRIFQTGMAARPGRDTIATLARALGHVRAVDQLRQLARFVELANPSVYSEAVPDLAYAYVSANDLPGLFDILKPVTPPAWRYAVVRRTSHWLGRLFRETRRRRPEGDRSHSRPSRYHSHLLFSLRSAARSCAETTTPDLPLILALRDLALYRESRNGDQVGETRAWLAMALLRAGKPQQALALIDEPMDIAAQKLISYGWETESESILKTAIPVLAGVGARSRVDHLAALLLEHMDSIFWYSMRSRADLFAILANALIDVDNQAQAATLLEAAVEFLTKKARDVPTQPKSQRAANIEAWRIFSENDLLEVARSITVLAEPMRLVATADLVDRAATLITVPEFVSSTQTRVHEHEVAFHLALGNFLNAHKAMDRLLETAQVSVDSGETIAARAGALASLARWLAQTGADRDKIEEFLAEAKGDAPSGRLVLDFAHLVDVAAAVSDICGLPEARQFIDSVVDVAELLSNRSGLVAECCIALAEAMSICQHATGLAMLLDYFRSVEWDEIGLAGKSFLSVIDALGKAHFVDTLGQAYVIALTKPGAFLCTPPALVAAVAVGLVHNQRLSPALHRLVEALSLADSLDDKDQQIVARAMVGRSAAQISALALADPDVSSAALVFARGCQSMTQFALETHSFAARNSAHLAEGGLAGIWAWMGQSDEALHWLERSTYGIWEDLTIPSMIEAFQHHNDHRGLARLVGIIQPVADQDGLGSWYRLMRKLGLALSQVGDLQWEVIAPAVIDGLRDAQSRGLVRVWGFIAALAPVLFRLGLLDPAWQAIERAEKLQIGIQRQRHT